MMIVSSGMVVSGENIGTDYWDSVMTINAGGIVYDLSVERNGVVDARRGSIVSGASVIGGYIGDCIGEARMELSGTGRDLSVSDGGWIYVGLNKAVLNPENVHCSASNVSIGKYGSLNVGSCGTVTDVSMTGGVLFVAGSGSASRITTTITSNGQIASSGAPEDYYVTLLTDSGGSIYTNDSKGCRNPHVFVNGYAYGCYINGGYLHVGGFAENIVLKNPDWYVDSAGSNNPHLTGMSIDQGGYAKDTIVSAGVVTLVGGGLGEPATLSNITTHSGTVINVLNYGSAVIDGQLTIGGILNTNGTQISCRPIYGVSHTVTFDLTERESAGANAMIDNIGNFVNAGMWDSVNVTVLSNQTNATYALAGGATSYTFSDGLTVNCMVGDDVQELGEVAVGGTLETEYGTYTLKRVNDKILFTVSGTAGGNAPAVTRPIVSVSTSAKNVKSVRLAATYGDDTAIKQYSTDKKTWKAYTNTLTVTVNGSYYFRALDAAGVASAITTYSVSNILVSSWSLGKTTLAKGKSASYSVRVTLPTMYKLSASLGMLTGTIAIKKGSTTVATGTVSKGKLAFNGGKRVKLDGTSTYTLTVKNSGTAAATISAIKLASAAGNGDDTRTSAVARGAVTKAGQAVASGWVGYGDVYDYSKFTLSKSTTLALTVTATGPTQFVVYNASGTALKSLMVKASGKTVTANMAALNLKAGTYYVLSKSTNSGDSDYTIKAGANTKFYPSNNKNDTVAAAKALSTTVNPLKGQKVTGWVGFGDATDYVKVAVSKKGKVSLDLNAATAKAYNGKQLKLSLLNASGKAVALKKIDADTLRTSSLLAAGTYYLGVTCANTAKYQTSYQVTTKWLAK